MGLFSVKLKAFVLFEKTEATLFSLLTIKLKTLH